MSNNTTKNETQELVDTILRQVQKQRRAEVDQSFKVMHIQVDQRDLAESLKECSVLFSKILETMDGLVSTTKELQKELQKDS